MTGPYPPYEGGDQPHYPAYPAGDQQPYPPQGPPAYPGQAQPQYPPVPPPQAPYPGAPTQAPYPVPPQQAPYPGAPQQPGQAPQPGVAPQWGQPPQPGQAPQWGQDQPWEQNPPTAPYPPVPPPHPAAAPGQMPPPWGGQAPEWASAPGPQPKRSLGAKVWPRVAGSLGVIVAVAVLALVKAGVGGFLDSGDEKGQAYPTASHPSGIAATSTATAAAGGPFAGTPAAKYPVGAAGITLPKAAASGVFTAKQVGDVLTTVKKALVAGRLDSKMLVSRDPDPFLKVLAPQARTDMRKDFSTDDFSVYATQFAPGAKPAKEAPRVKGRISYRATKVEGIPALEVTTNFVWVYPFQVSGAAGDGIVVVHDELVWQVLQSSKVRTAVRGLWLSEGQSYASNIDCDQYDKGLIAPGKPDLAVGPDTDDPDSMFDPERTLDIDSNC